MNGSKGRERAIKRNFQFEIEREIRKKNKALNAFLCDETNSFPFIWRLYLYSVKPYRKNKWGYSSLSEAYMCCKSRILGQRYLGQPT